ncbi:uncharacterized protein VICG_00897 [Vittaforma corneae ATCC 50505]|uniref:Ribosome biogenesis regulatory protein n=1 Tax=Vittaforma corneae (strain ATCC 50505) TaxID=993615 RepID=L2GMC8_VITCO|nr:uncharacterized protein VICG_00897 [Vittaforma corneae ATCC 50505]ELA42048.1 hypothetical protein VICG_00897 [Vittaforma corneae ATCC 50505]
MQIIQQFLTAITEENTDTTNSSAQKMIKELVGSIKNNKSKRVEGSLIFEINPSLYILPKSINEEKESTKWESFAREKGIKKKKRSRMVFSEKFNKWLPRYGSRSEQNLILQGGVVEVKQSMSKMINEKRKRAKKNKENAEKNKNKHH